MGLERLLAIYEEVRECWKGIRIQFDVRGHHGFTTMAVLAQLMLSGEEPADFGEVRAVRAPYFPEELHRCGLLGI